MKNTHIYITCIITKGLLQVMSLIYTLLHVRSIKAFATIYTARPVTNGLSVWYSMLLLYYPTCNDISKEIYYTGINPSTDESAIEGDGHTQRGN